MLAPVVEFCEFVGVFLRADVWPKGAVALGLVKPWTVPDNEIHQTLNVCLNRSAAASSARIGRHVVLALEGTGGEEGFCFIV